MPSNTVGWIECRGCGVRVLAHHDGKCAECWGNTDPVPSAEEPLHTSTQQSIIDITSRIKYMLLEKNRKYGDSALSPVRIFAKSDNCEQLRVRLDDKLNRLRNRQDDEDEDVVDDLIGYLILYKIALERNKG